MIKIGKNKKNYIYTTFSERMDDVDNDILLVFENETNPGVNYSIILEYNESNIIRRIDKYEIEEDMDITNGSTHSITLPYIGFYTYNAYEVIRDADDVDVYKHIEKGRCKVYDGSDGSTQSLIDDVYL